METTQNMGLTEWNNDGDFFTPQQLADNFTLIDNHDHSEDKGVQISTAGIAPDAITSALIAPGAVGNSQLAANAVGTANIQDGSITSALLAAGAISASNIAAGSIDMTKLDANVLPLGSILMWWRPSTSNLLPGGDWEIMDGRPWNIITNAWNLTTGNIPDSRGLFPSGASLTGSGAFPPGTVGGNATLNLAHAHYVEPHSHTVPAHNHAIDPDGSHYHSFEGYNLWERANAFASGVTITDIAGAQHTNIYGSMYLPIDLFGYEGDAGGAVGVPMDYNGEHSHGGATEYSNWMYTSNSDSTTDYQLSQVDLVPATLVLLLIMRCR